MSLVPPQAYRKTEFTHRTGLAADRPAAADVLPGTIYFATDTLLLTRSDGSTWAAYSNSSSLSNVAYTNVANVFTENQTISKASPLIRLIDTAQAADHKKFLIFSYNEVLYTQGVNDAEAATYGSMAFTRLGDLTITGNFACNAGGITANSLQLTGTWSPVLGGSTSESGQTYSVQQGYYIKIGDFVNVMFNMAFSAAGTITGNLTIKNLPYVVANLANHYPVANLGYWQNLNTALVHLTAFGTPSTTSLSLYGATAAATSLSALTNTFVTNSTQIVGSFQYRTA